MNTPLVKPPAVLCFSGQDPSGGAGSQADNESLFSLGSHCCSAITALTAQDTRDVKEIFPTPATLLIEQARAILEDMDIKAIKIGMVGNVANIEAIHSVLMDYPQIPMVLDPVIASGGGTELADSDVTAAMRSLLLPQATLITPNSMEAKAIAQEADSLTACAHELMDLGSEHVLITGTHEKSPQVINRLWGGQKHISDFNWERLPHQYHGSGCTLAASIAALLAHGFNITAAVRDAQAFTWNSLKNAHQLGMGQWIPNRLFWVDGQTSNCGWHKAN